MLLIIIIYGNSEICMSTLGVLIPTNKQLWQTEFCSTFANFSLTFSNHRLKFSSLFDYAEINTAAVWVVEIIFWILYNKGPMGIEEPCLPIWGSCNWLGIHLRCCQIKKARSIYGHKTYSSVKEPAIVLQKKKFQWKIGVQTQLRIARMLKNQSNMMPTVQITKHFWQMARTLSKFKHINKLNWPIFMGSNLYYIGRPH